MSEKTLRLLLGLLVGLAIVYAGVMFASGRSPSLAYDSTEIRAALERLAIDSLGVVTIQPPDGDRIELQRRTSGWTVNGFPTDSQAIDRLNSAIDNATVASLVGRNAANHARFGVADDSTWSVAFVNFDSDTTQVLIGDAGSRYPSAYVRWPGSDDVWQVDGDLRNALTRTIADWRDRTIARFDTSRIATLIITRSDTTATLTRTDSVWSVAGPAGSEPADSARVAQLLDALRNLRATGFAPDTVDLGDTNLRTLVALDMTGDTLAAVEFHGRDSRWYARPSEGTTTFELASYTVDNLTPRREELVRDSD